ncbi:hypothetical protein OG394_08630 [Kribbella sp. NBC_01245]|uniref:hypothetical protein n=1 Tax=Kribbella sp. NBC_01245 TaxID=2903578 RepID=UPI002E27EB13|nr:hypothetical protein [Kribbella sp. NBC_01245]
MRVRRASAALLAAILVMSASPALADPGGTRVLNPTPTDQAYVRILGASAYGILYKAASLDYGLDVAPWLKPAGGTPVQVSPEFSELAGSMVFAYDNEITRVSYRTVTDTTIRSCLIDGSLPSRIFLPTGWITSSRTGLIQQTIAGSDGCTTRTIATIPNGRLTGADATGFTVEITTNVGNGGVHDLQYRSFAEPTKAWAVHTGDQVYNYVSVANGVVAWPAGLDDPNGALHRWKVGVGAQPVVQTGAPIRGTAVTAGGAAAFQHTPPTDLTGYVVGTVAAGSTTPSTLTGGHSLAGDGTTFYIARLGSQTTIDRGTSVTSLQRLVTLPLLPPGTFAISLGASRVAYLDTDGTDSAPGVLASTLHSRTYSKSGTTITLGTSQNDGEALQPLDADGGRMLMRIGGRLIVRTEGSADRIIFTATNQHVVADGFVRLSGTRALWTRGEYSGDPCDPGCPQYDIKSAMLYDLRTGTSVRLGDAKTTKYALWGSYLVWANKDGSMYRRDLSSGKVVQVKAAGYGVVAMDVWGAYVGWSECAVALCQTGVVAYRNVRTMSAVVKLPTKPVATAVKVTGGHVVYAIPTTYGGGARLIRELRLGSTANASITEFLGWSGPRDAFDAHDEVLAWIATDGSARIAPNSSYVDPPSYLGNALGSSSFTPNGDGVSDRWTPAFPISKALPTCALTIRSGTTVVRALSCASATGRVDVAWDGRNATGRLMPKAKYTWTLTGRDADGPLRWWTGSTSPIAGTVTLA